MVEIIVDVKGLFDTCKNVIDTSFYQLNKNNNNNKIVKKWAFPTEREN